MIDEQYVLQADEGKDVAEKLADLQGMHRAVPIYATVLDEGLRGSQSVNSCVAFACAVAEDDGLGGLNLEKKKKKKKKPALADPVSSFVHIDCILVMPGLYMCSMGTAGMPS